MFYIPCRQPKYLRECFESIVSFNFVLHSFWQFVKYIYELFKKHLCAYLNNSLFVDLQLTVLTCIHVLCFSRVLKYKIFRQGKGVYIFSIIKVIISGITTIQHILVNKNKVNFLYIVPDSVPGRTPSFISVRFSSVGMSENWVGFVVGFLFGFNGEMFVWFVYFLGFWVRFGWVFVWLCFWGGLDFI